MRETFEKKYNFNDKDVEVAVEKYREYYSKYGIMENKLYDGIENVLKKLKERKKKLIVATSKPTVFTEKILKHYDIYQYFDFISGATLDKSRNKKEEIIKFAIDELNIDNMSKCIMIGDKGYDIIGANNNGMDSIGVLYGYGTLEELTNENATYIINDVKDIINKVDF